MVEPALSSSGVGRPHHNYQSVKLIRPEIISLERISIEHMMTSGMKSIDTLLGIAATKEL